MGSSGASWSFVILLVLFSIFGLLFLTLGGIRLLLIYALVGAFVVALCLIFLVHISFITPLMFRERDKALLRSIMVGAVWNGSCLVTCFGNVLTLLLLRFLKNPLVSRSHENG